MRASALLIDSALQRIAVETTALIETIILSNPSLYSTKGRKNNLFTSALVRKSDANHQNALSRNIERQRARESVDSNSF